MICTIKAICMQFHYKVFVVYLINYEDIRESGNLKIKSYVDNISYYRYIEYIHGQVKFSLLCE